MSADAEIPDELLIGDCLAPRELFPAGTFAAICYAVVDLGTQTVKAFKGNESYKARKVAICWEFPKLRIQVEDEQGNVKDLPRSRRQFFTFSLSEKSNLRKTLEAWRGEGFTTEEMKKINIFSLVGASAFIQIIHEKKEDGAVNDKMNSIMPLPEEMADALKEMENPPLKYAYNKAAKRWPPFPDNMPEYMRNTVFSSTEWEEQNRREGGAPAATGGAGVPAPQTANKKPF